MAILSLLQVVGLRFRVGSLGFRAFGLGVGYFRLAAKDLVQGLRSGACAVEAYNSGLRSIVMILDSHFTRKIPYFPSPALLLEPRDL